MESINCLMQYIIDIWYVIDYNVFNGGGICEKCKTKNGSG